MMVPTVDILMTTYNGVKYVGEQIASIQVQSYCDWRLLISDDCSSDGTTDAAKRIAQLDDRIHVVSEGIRFGGAKQNFMALVQHAEAPYVMFCNQDDVWLPRKIERLFIEMKSLEAEYGCDKPLLVFSDMAVVDERLEVISPTISSFYRIDCGRILFSQILAHNIAAGCTMMINGILCSLYQEALNVQNIVKHDWWAMLTAAAFGHIGFVDEPLSLHRRHSTDKDGALDYSFGRRVLKLNATPKDFKAATEQAREFLRVHASNLDQQIRDELENFITVHGGKALQEDLPIKRESQHENDLAKAEPGCQIVNANRMERRVFGGIVTYNPDEQRLKENMAAIASQVNALIVFDNASSDMAGIRALIRSLQADGQQILLIENSTNCGMARALNAIMRVARNCGADAVILLDQDSVAASNLVEELLPALEGDCGLAAPRVVDRNVEHVAATVTDAGSPRAIKRAITSGSLVSVAVWDAVGGYDERLFVDWADMEFCANLRVHGYRLLEVDSTSILHEMGNQEYAWSAPGRAEDGNASLRRGYYRQNYPAWRWRDRARSQAITIGKYQWSLIGAEELYRFVKGTLLRAVLLEKDRRELLRAIINGYCEGVRAR